MRFRTIAKHGHDMTLLLNIFILVLELHVLVNFLNASNVFPKIFVNSMEQSMFF